MNIKTALVLMREHCSDKIFLYTELPSPFFQGHLQNSTLSLMFDATQGTGAEYVKKHFGIQPEIIDTRNKR